MLVCIQLVYMFMYLVYMIKFFVFLIFPMTFFRNLMSTKMEWYHRKNSGERWRIRRFIL